MNYAGKTQKEVAQHLGLSVKSLQRYLNGAREPKKDIQDAILKACEVPTATTTLLAAMRREHLIGTIEHEFIEVFCLELIEGVDEASKAHPGLLTSRWAKLHATATLKQISATLTRVQAIKDSGQIENLG